MERLGRYEILEELGRGAMGTVYRGRDPKIDRIVAIKTIRLPGVGGNEEQAFRERFLREAQAAGNLSHAGIVTIYDVGEEESTRTPYIVMEFVSGKSVENLLREAEGGRLPPERALALAQQVAEALDYAHGQGIVHRDIKPANILVTQEGRAKIADFGIAKIAASHMTMTGELLGTPSYMSPEQISGSPVDGRSDLFSLGIIVYLSLTGRKPFSGENLTEISFKIAYQDPVPPSQAHSELSPGVDYLIERALAKDPVRRYASGKDFASDLDDLRQGREPRSQEAFVATSMAAQTVITQAAAPIPALAAHERTVAGVLVTVEGRSAAMAIPVVTSEKKRRFALAAAILLLLLLGGAGWWWFSGGADSASATGPTRAARRAGQPAGGQTSSKVPASNRSQLPAEETEAAPPGERPGEPSETRLPTAGNPSASSPSKSKEKGPPPWAPARGRRGR